MIKGVVSAGDILTAKAGEYMLQEGGNAYDAMVASLLAAPICEPILTSLGGGGFMLSCKNDEEPTIYDFFVDVPKIDKKITPQFYPIDVDFGTTIQQFHIGVGASAIPGMPKGIWSIYEELCSMSFEDLIKPALKYCTEGVYLSKKQADFLKLLEPIFLSEESSRKLYGKNGKLIDENDIFKNFEYANFLQEFAKKGESIFYNGEIADELEKLSKKYGGYLTTEELKRYKIKKRKPIKLKYKDFEIYTNTPPSSGGILIAFSLMLLNDVAFSKKDKNYLIKLLESQEVTADFRKRYVNEYLHDKNILKILDDVKLIDSFKKEYKKRVNFWGNTTHISIIDKDHNVASTTSTNGEGSGHIIPHCGLMLNNMLGEEDLNPHGFFKWDSGIRLPSMMSPTAVYKNKELQLALGSAGSNRIRSAILQVMLNYCDFGMDIQKSINEPRLHYENSTLFLEPPLDISLEEDIDVVKFEEINLFFGGVQAVTRDFKGGADPRRGAYSIVVK